MRPSQTLKKVKMTVCFWHFSLVKPSLNILLANVAAFLLLLSCFGAKAESPLKQANRAIINANFSAHRYPPCPTCEEDEWRASGFNDVEIVDLDLYGPIATSAPRPFSHAISVDIVVLRDSGWTLKEVQKKYQETAAVFAQCNIKITRAKAILATSPINKVDFDLDPRNTAGDMARIVSATPKPRVGVVRAFHIRSFTNGAVGFANPDSFLGDWGPYTNEAWLTKGAIDYKHSATAHELAHIFLNCFHQDEHSSIPKEFECTPHLAPVKNLMSDVYAYGENKLSSTQCDKMKNYKKLVRPLHD